MSKYNREVATRAQAKYDAENTFRVSLKFNIKTDADIMEKLAEVSATGGEGKQTYIKRLIREDIQRGA